MIDLRRILVPTDFSRYSQNALRYAAAFAEKFGAELYLLHVVQDLSVYLPEVETVPQGSPPPVDQLAPAVRRSLDRAIREGRLEHLPVSPEMREGTPHHEIIAFAREMGIDLIVMGTHGRTGLARVLLGSVAERVVRQAPCPVFTVRHPEHEFIPAPGAAEAVG